jgi:hypothetical protein
MRGSLGDETSPPIAADLVDAVDAVDDFNDPQDVRFHVVLFLTYTAVDAVLGCSTLFDAVQRV